MFSHDPPLEERTRIGFRLFPIIIFIKQKPIKTVLEIVYAA